MVQKCTHLEYQVRVGLICLELEHTGRDLFLFVLDVSALKSALRSLS